METKENHYTHFLKSLVSACEILSDFLITWRYVGADNVGVIKVNWSKSLQQVSLQQGSITYLLIALVQIGGLVLTYSIKTTIGYLSNKVLFPWPHLNTRRVGRIRDSYANLRLRLGFA